MTWLTWRQHRTELLLLVGVVGAIAAVLVGTGQEIHRVYDASGIAGCLYTYAFPGDCGRAYDAFVIPYDKVRGLMPWLNLLPLFYGILLGVPLLAREYEQGTYKFAWTQGVSRRRWLLTKIAVLLAILLALSLGLTAIMTWWNAPFDTVSGRFVMASWDFEGLMPTAFAVFSFALGTAAGSALRHVVPAVVVTFAYIPLWLVADIWLRTVVPPPLSVQFALGDGPTLTRQDWHIADEVVDRFGHPVYSAIPACPPATPCPGTEGLQEHLIYQPASRFWEIHGVEAGILVAAALLLLGFALWRTRSRAG